jgi:hypothetical protein
MSHCVLTEIDEPFAPYPKEALFLNAANDKEKVKKKKINKQKE